MSLLEVDDVVVQFGGVTAVDHASFAAEAGRVTGLIGPNGAGKTTCFNVISGLQKPNRGRVRFDGRDITRLPVHRRSRRGMGRTFQRLEAFGSLTVRDNVRVALDIHRGLAGLVRPAAADVDALLERVGIAAYADERADSIPTGTARLLELARCLAGDPKLLLLDEPSSGPRRGGDRRVRRAAGASSPPRAAAILMVEHDMDLVMAVCDEHPRPRLRRGDRVRAARRRSGPTPGAAGLPRLLRRRAGRTDARPTRSSPMASGSDERPDPRGRRPARGVRPDRGAARRRPAASRRAR